MLRPATAEDAAAIAAIYNEYVLNTVISFEVDAVSSEEMARRIAQVQADGLPWLVLENGTQIVGYAYASKWKPRVSYRYTVETSVYVDSAKRGQHLGSRLYLALLDELRGRKLHVAIAGVAQPNPSSDAFHQKLGFRKVAHFAQVGFKMERWIDMVYWQLELNEI